MKVGTESEVGTRPTAGDVSEQHTFEINAKCVSRRAFKQGMGGNLLHATPKSFRNATAGEVFMKVTKNECCKKRQKRSLTSQIGGWSLKRLSEIFATVALFQLSALFQFSATNCTMPIYKTKRGNRIRSKPCSHKNEA